MKTSARAAAIEILSQWEKTAQPIDRLLDEGLPPDALADRRDYSLTMALVYGVLRWRGYLDWLLTDYSRHPLDKMKSRTRQALRVGLYQLLFMDRVPAAAALNETVKALKSAGQPGWLIGFVNGLLRNLSRRRPELPAPGQVDAALPAAAALSHPDWLFERWQKRYGRNQALAICRQNNSQPPLSLRVNTKLTTVAQFIKNLSQAGLAAQPGFFAPAAVRLTEYSGPVAQIPGYAEGCFQVQDEAAQLVAGLLLPLRPGQSYLDGCAGLGGKTSQLAEMLPAGDPPARLLAVEPNERRLRLLKENLARLQLAAPVHIFHTGLETLRDQPGQFAGILLDVPCSGLGVIRRHPDIRWSRQPADLGRYRQKQLALLGLAAPLAAPGGIVVYATCSMEPEENEEVVLGFLAAHPEFALTDGKNFLPPAAAELVDGQGFLRTVPDERGLDGFFAARLVKRTTS